MALGKTRSSTRAVEADTTGPFVRNGVYGPFKRGLYEFAWFDSEPERAVANIVDGVKTVTAWARLHRNDLPLVWNSDGREYNPDLRVVESDGTHWVVETKMNKEMTSDEVRDNRKAAVTWTNLVNASGKVDGTWKYLLLSEDDIDQSQESWPALKNLGS